jgi:hypothetical protein
MPGVAALKCGPHGCLIVGRRGGGDGHVCGEE